MKKILFTMIFSIMILPFISCKGKNSGYSRLLYEGEALMALSPDAVNAYVDKNLQAEICFLSLLKSRVKK